MTEFSNKEEYIKEEDFVYQEGRGWKEKSWDFIGGKYFVPIAIVLIAIIAFSLGRVSGLQDKREPVRILNNAPQPPSYNQEGGTETNTQSGILLNKNQTQTLQNTAAVGASDTGGGSVVASKNGTKYHYPWCAGAKQISEKNKITFNSIEEARAKGYTPASNCKGLK